MKTILASLILAASAVPASASAANGLADRFAAVCESVAVKSEALQAACASGEPPAALKDGTRFKAIGIGAELNALAANLHLMRSQ
jgi:hypothetical protein